MGLEKNLYCSGPLEQFVLLAKSAKGAACNDLIRQALEAPGVYVFSELLNMPNVQELGNATTSKYIKTLNLFAYGTYKDYLQEKDTLLELTDGQRKKLQHLTIVTLATKSKCIPYKLLLDELDLVNVRDLEDLIIEAIYADIIHGKLDQKHKQLEVDYAIGRDTHAEDVNTIVNCLQDWCTACENVLSCVETQINRANTEKSKAIQKRNDIEQEVVNIKKTLKTQIHERPDGMDDVMGSSDPTISSEKSTKKSGKGKSKSKLQH